MDRFATVNHDQRFQISVEYQPKHVDLSIVRKNQLNWSIDDFHVISNLIGQPTTPNTLPALEQYRLDTCCALQLFYNNTNTLRHYNYFFIPLQMTFRMWIDFLNIYN